MQLPVPVLHTFVVDRGAPVNQFGDRLLIGFDKLANVGEAPPKILLDPVPDHLVGKDFLASFTCYGHECGQVLAATVDFSHVGSNCGRSVS